jgi:signal transduction histidine kinase
VLHALGLQLGIALENLDALDSLLRQKDMLASVFEGISDPLLLADGSRRPILANRSARDLAGASGEGRLLDTLLDLAGSRVPGPPASQGAALPQSREVRLPDGRSFALHIYPLQGPSDGTGEGAAGHDQRLIVYARESTAEKRMLDQIQQGEKLVAVGNLAAGLAHEINNPLGVILCYAQLLKESLGEDQAQADLEVIVRNTKQAQKVLQDLLDFARPKTSRTGPCDPAEVVRSLAGVFTARAKTDGVSLDVDLPDPAAPPDQKIGLPLVRLDAATLEQILTNLLINAFDAVASDTVPPGQGRITLRAARRDGEVRLSVADNGLGIPAEAMGRIFDPFFTTKEVGKGTGLGLTMVYGLLQEYGGRIEAANNPGGGAVFTLHLPAAGTPARDTRTETAAEAAEETA